MNMIEWTCTYCSLFTKTVNKVKHLYIFLKKMKILKYFTLAQEKLKI